MASPSDRPTINIIDCNHVAYDIADTKVRERVTAIENTGVNGIKDMAFEEKKDWTSQDDLANAITILQSNFQAGVDTVANACIGMGSAPEEPYTPEHVRDAIYAIQTGGNYMTKEITQDGTYYASDDDVDAYDQVIVAVRGGLRPHTVTFLDQDEETVLEVIRDVPWGGGATYHGPIPSTSGMRFVGWTPNPVYVTEDLWCKPRFENVIYHPDQIQDDWVTIARKCEQDVNYYPTGSWKLMEFTPYNNISPVSVKMQLVAKRTDPMEGENGYANTTQIAMSTLGFSKQMQNVSSAWNNPWHQSDLYNYLNNEFLNNCFPQELVSYVKPVIKWTRCVLNDTVYVDYPSLNTLWIPSIKEVGSFSDYTYTDTETLGTFYDVAFGTDGQPSKAGKAKGNDYWLRSVFRNNTSYCTINTQGNSGVDPPNTNSKQIMMGFCL